MKKILLLLIACLAQISCQRVFVEDKENSFIISSPGDLETALAGIYHKLAGLLDPSHGTTVGCSDDVIESLGSFSVYLLYTDSYVTIACANDIIKKSGGLEKTGYVKQLLGEVYFIRGLCYFNLARWYGRPPLVYNTDISYILKKPGYAQVYDSIESDLKRAINYLPATFKESRKPYLTPHQGTAKALLAEVYLARGGYPVNDNEAYRKAWEMAGEVIEDAEAYNYNLLPDFANLWDGRHEPNPELVFGEFYLFSGRFSSSGWVDDSVSSQTMFDGTNKIVEGYFTGTTSPKFFNNYPGQYRKDKTYQTFQKIFFISGTIDTVHITHINQDKKGMAYMPLKKYYSNVDSIGFTDAQQLSQYSQNPANDPYSHYTGHLIYLYRYAHTLLTYAEAKARDNQLDAAAYEAVNEVRRRANKVDISSPSVYDLPPGLSAAAFADSVLQERAYEFCGEPMNRCFDLLRTGQLSKLDEFVLPYKVDWPLNPEYFYNIPSGELNLEPYLN